MDRPQIKLFEEKTRPKSHYYGDLFFLQSTFPKTDKVRRKINLPPLDMLRISLWGIKLFEEKTRAKSHYDDLFFKLRFLRQIK